MHCNDKATEQAHWIGKAKRIEAAKSQEVREMEENNTKRNLKSGMKKSFGFRHSALESLSLSPEVCGFSSPFLKHLSSFLGPLSVY